MSGKQKQNTNGYAESSITPNFVVGGIKISISFFNEHFVRVSITTLILKPKY
jgi:hypothetical protein